MRDGQRASVAVFAAALLLACADVPAERQRPELVLLISLDTTRADHLGFYGYERPTSPNLDDLAGEALVYDRATATATWTLPSHASVFTGKFAASHGAEYDPEGPLRLSSGIQGLDAWDLLRAGTISESETTLAEHLRAAGFATGAVVGGPWLKSVFRLGRGFDHYDDRNITTANGRAGEDLTDAALEWLEQTEGPRFLFLNYFDPHNPFSPPTEFEARLRPKLPIGQQEDAVVRYDAEILYMDHHIGRLIQALRDARLYQDTLIVVFADHGELLGEHGDYGHGDTPFEEVVRIPLLVKDAGPHPETGRSDKRVQLTDVFALILDRVGLPLPAGIQGAVPPTGGHPILVESRVNPLAHRTGDWTALYDGDLKYISNSYGNHMLFDLDSDPREERNLLTARADTGRAMQATIDETLKNLPRRPANREPTQQIDAETQKALKSLGYID